MAKIDLWFPEPIYVVESLGNKNIEQHKIVLNKHKKFFRNEFKDVDSTHKINNLHDDDNFKHLFYLIYEHLDKFRIKLGYESPLKINMSWFNVSFKGDFLSQHIHNGSVLSGAYYLESGNDDKIYFHKTLPTHVEPQKYNVLNFEYCSYKCKVDSLLLFKSNLPHSTPRQLSNKKIVLSFNAGF
jgi:uncharacterized protein (TIGR02466 family)